MGKTFEIEVGTIFFATEHPTVTELIVDTGKDEFFYSTRCKLDGNLTTVLDMSGTHTPDYIGKIANTISFSAEEVELLLISYWEAQLGHKIDKELLDSIRIATATPPRRIKLG
jgi:hypothetical protein